MASKNRAQKQKQEPVREVAIFVSGERIASGSLADMQLRFNQEIALHRADVEMRAKGADGIWGAPLRKRTVMGLTR